jgi:hypothetical protein
MAKKCKSCKGNGYINSVIVKDRKYFCAVCNGKGFLYQREETPKGATLQATLEETRQHAKEQFEWELAHVDKKGGSLGIANGPACPICKKIMIETKKVLKGGKVVQCCRTCKRAIVEELGFDVQTMSANQIAERLKLEAGIQPDAV